VVLIIQMIPSRGKETDECVVVRFAVIARLTAKFSLLFGRLDFPKMRNSAADRHPATVLRWEKQRETAVRAIRGQRRNDTTRDGPYSEFRRSVHRRQPGNGNARGASAPLAQHPARIAQAVGAEIGL
jgi:hypothetical protein